MGIHYQAFNCKLIILYIVFIILSFCFLKQARAYDSIFIVENIKVDVTAENSVIAQNKAFDEAQKIAFGILAKRMVEEAQVNSVATPNALTISSLIKDYEVTDEKLSAVRYIGTYTFRFREAAVSKFFSVSGVKFTDKSSQTLLVLPIFQKHGKNMLWSEHNIWFKAWGRSNNFGGLVPIEVPIGDLMDIADIDESNVLSYERLKLDRMLGRYDAKEAAIMIAIPDAKLANIEDENAKITGNMRVSIYRTDRAMAEHVRDINIKSKPDESLAQFYDRAVSQAYSALQKDWKRKTLASAAQSKIFKVRGHFKNIKQWLRLRKNIENIADGGVSILSMQKNSAKLSFKYRGDEQQLRSDLAKSGIYLQQEQRQIMGNSYNQNDIIYDLRFGSKSGRSSQQNFYNAIVPAAGENANSDVLTF